MKILLVDDDPLFHKIMGTSLARKGCEIIFAFDGEEALEKTHENKFDLVITDIIMPRKEGIEVIQEIKEIHPNTKILAISSGGRVGHSSFLKLADAVGADATLEKPFTPAQLIIKVEELTGGD